MRGLHPLFFLVLAWLSGCQEQVQVKKEIPQMSSMITVHISEQGEAFAKRYPNQIRVDRQPAGLTFYNLDWKVSKPGAVTIEHGKHTFLIDNVIGVMGTQDGSFSEEGLSELTITAGITAPELISHDEARQKTFAILKRIVQAGWKPFIDRGDPRLRGRDNLDYVLKTSIASSLDPTYEPTLKEWMLIESQSTWYFYADHVYLGVSFTREHTLTDPDKPGAYLINFNLVNESEHFRAHVNPHDRKRWKELLSAELRKLAPMRIEAETAMRAKGFKIDETYQDPPAPSFIKQ